MTEKYILDEQVGYMLRLAMQRHTSIFQSLAPMGLTPTQFSALVRLDEVGPCSQNQLGRLTAMDVATIKGVVERLKDKGLVMTAADPADKRRSLVSLTEAGAAAIPELHRVGAVITERTLDGVSDDQRAKLWSILQCML